MSRLTIVLGGTRSGKSAVGEALVARHLGPLLYVATGVADGDPDMAERIAAHRQRRDPRFTVVEAGDDLAGAVAALPARPALVDALGPWVARRPDLVVEAAPLVAALAGRTAPTVVVSEEVGLGVHPATEVGRRFRDVLGALNQAVAAAADEALLVVAGRVLRLDPLDVVVPPAPLRSGEG